MDGSIGVDGRIKGLMAVQLDGWGWTAEGGSKLMCVDRFGVDD